MSNPTPRNGLLLPPDHPASIRQRNWRMAKDVLARYGVAIGGIGVIIAIALIFFYLLYVVLPMFKPASIEAVARYPVPGEASPTLHLAMEEQAELAVRYSADGAVNFFELATGRVLDRQQLAMPTGVTVSGFAAGSANNDLAAFGLSNGRISVVRHEYQTSYPDNVRVLTPKLKYPYGPDPLLVDPRGQALSTFAIQADDDDLTVVARSADGRVLLAHYFIEQSLLGDDLSIEHDTTVVLNSLGNPADYILLDDDQRYLYLAGKNGALLFFDVADKQHPRLLQQLNLVAVDEQLTSLNFLTGDISLLAADSSGGISQWFAVRDEHNELNLARIRAFDDQRSAIRALAAEPRRKGFLAASDDGRVGIYHATAERTLLVEPVTDSTPTHLAVAPRANALLLQDEAGQMQFWRIHNEHPEISWSALWTKVWYERYPEPEYVWQSSASSNDFEPKFSLMPLTFGTIKAAFYAMLIAIPLSIMGAIYTAYFMAPRMRRLVKPSIEIMEALPTVILGFLAGLWLAPLMEIYLPGVFALLIILPLGVLLFAYLWQLAPANLRNTVPEGWDAALLIPVVILLGWLAFALSGPLEAALFNGDMRGWLTTDLGIDFDQRNALVVGIAMGFAVIPTIFSIAEDAIFSVPKHLSFGSLALGATPWQTMLRVVLLTASPGIFSAVMIGMGRAVGETMIVLMATGNTPVMDFSIFQGMRTLSANIAVEMPESEVASTHYRVLFLAALVLFLFTFLVNTFAEVVRHRLRRKYSSL